MASGHRHTRPAAASRCRRARSLRSLVKAVSKVRLRRRSCRAVRGQRSRAWNTSRSRAVTRVAGGVAMPRVLLYHRSLRTVSLSPCMAAEKKSFINVDQLMPKVALEDVARYYGVELPEL